MIYSLDQATRFLLHCFFFFQAEDGIRDLVRSRGLGDVYKRQEQVQVQVQTAHAAAIPTHRRTQPTTVDTDDT